MILSSQIVREIRTGLSFNQKLILGTQFLNRFGRDARNQFTLFFQWRGNHGTDSHDTSRRHGASRRHANLRADVD